MFVTQDIATMQCAYIMRNARRFMHSRFWTFAAAANVFLFLNTITVIFFEKEKSQQFEVSLFHRTAAHWVDGAKVWREFYDSAYTDASYTAFLPQGLKVMGCTEMNMAPLCECLSAAHALGVSRCKAAAKGALSRCLMMARPVVEVTELKETLNLFALLSTLNMWGMLGSVVIWIRMYICKEDESMPYWIQFVLGLFGAIIHSAVLQPHVGPFVTFVVITTFLSILSYLHRLDQNWWISTYMLQYLFTVPNFALLAFIGTQKRDMLYLTVSTILAVAFGMMSMGRSILDDSGKDSVEMRGSVNMVRIALFFIILVLTMSAYDDGGHYFLHVSHLTTHANAFSVALLFYLLLGMICPNSIKRVCFLDWSLRFVLSMLMQTELIVKPK